MTVAVDVAGGVSGGAGRFRAQLLAYLDRRPGPDVRLLGETRSVAARWLLQRERAAQGALRVIAANNVGFLLAGQERWTLLRNANHFLDPGESQAVERLLPRSFPVQRAMVQAAARRSDMLVVPSTSMAERVAAAVPALADRLVVRLHPLTVDFVADPSPSRPVILVPVVPSAFKRLDEHLLLLAQALDLCDLPDVQVVSTLRPDQAPDALRTDPRFVWVGVLDRTALAAHYARAVTAYYPTQVESFGYPLAECRSAGLPVLAQASAHNAEIAGASLCGYTAREPDSLAAALGRALQGRPAPDPGPFEPGRYFDWLLRGAR